MVRCDYAIDCSECNMVPCPHDALRWGQTSGEDDEDEADDSSS